MFYKLLIKKKVSPHARSACDEASPIYRNLPHLSTSIFPSLEKKNSKFLINKLCEVWVEVSCQYLGEVWFEVSCQYLAFCIKGLVPVFAFNQRHQFLPSIVPVFAISQFLPSIKGFVPVFRASFCIQSKASCRASFCIIQFLQGSSCQFLQGFLPG